MALPVESKKNKISADWLVRGSLTRIGDIFDRLTGRGYKPSSSLATSELIERMKFLMDSEAEQKDGRLFVPHNIKLKMQWDKFSTDSTEALRALENEFLIAAVDHINDKRYCTKAPMHVEAKPDYFTLGVKLFVSFDLFADDDEEAAISVAMPGETKGQIDIGEEILDKAERIITVRFSFGGNPFEKELRIGHGERLSVGRTKENDLAIDDPSISKYHASLALDTGGNLLLADTGSTNGTFVNGTRIAYGKTATVSERDKVRFGLVDANFKMPPMPVTTSPTEIMNEVPDIPDTETYKVGDLEFTSRTENLLPPTSASVGVPEEYKQPVAAPTVAAIDVPKNGGDSVAEQPPPTSTSIEMKEEDDIEIP